MTTLSSMPTRTRPAMSQRESHCLMLIRQLSARGYKPTLQEVATNEGLSKVTVFETVKRLKRKGWLAETRELTLADDPKDQAIREIAERLRRVAENRDLEFEESSQLVDIALELESIAGAK